MQKTKKQSHTMPKNLEDGIFIYVPSPMILKTSQLLGIKDITPYALQTVALKALADFIDSDLFTDYRMTLRDSAEILEVFQAETEKIIEEIKKEQK